MSSYQLARLHVILWAAIATNLVIQYHPEAWPVAAGAVIVIVLQLFSLMRAK